MNMLFVVKDTKNGTYLYEDVFSESSKESASKMTYEKATETRDDLNRKTLQKYGHVYTIEDCLVE